MEIDDFEYFKSNQLYKVDFNTGKLDTKSIRTASNGKNYTIIRYDVGSKNKDGYIRLFCNGVLRMKHRLLYYLYHNKLPIEIDHINGIRDDNNIINLRSVTRKEQLQNYHYGSKKGYPKRKLTDDDVRFIRSRLETKSCSELAKMFNVSRTCISDIKNKRRHINTL